MTAPIKRRPGRPRKNPLPVETEEVPTGTTEAPVEERGERPSADPNDPRIGLECHPGATQVGFDDGSVYEAEGGYLTRRL